MGLKGKTTIELTDINSGEVTVIEDTNFVTTALEQLCQPVLKNQFTLDSSTFRREGGCSTEALFRGLLLFDTTLEENTNRFAPPTNAKMIGHGCEILYTGVDTSLGSYNASQSNTGTESERSYTWDFTSEQANGLIKSICLTTQVGGYIGYGTERSIEEVESAMRPFSNISKGALVVKSADSLFSYNRVPVYMSLKNDYVVQCDFQRIPTGILYFYKVNLDSNKVDIFKQFPQHGLWDATTRDSSYVGAGYTSIEAISINLASELGTGTYFGMAQDGKYLYVTDLRGSSESAVANAWQPGTKIKMVKLDLETFGYEVIEVTNTTGTSIGLRVGFTNMATGTYTFGVANGYMYVRGWVGSTGNDVAPLYAINLANNTDTKQVTSPDGSVNMVGISSVANATPFLMSFSGLPVFTHVGHRPNNSPTSGNVFANAVTVKNFSKAFLNASIFSFNTLGGISQIDSSATARSFPVDNDLYFAVEYRSSSSASTETAYRLLMNPLTLMTVNNLSTPVEKTPAQTMRITYKLTKE